MLGTETLTFELVVVGVSREENIREKLLKTVPCVSGPVLHVGPYRLVQLHHELLRRRAQLLNHLIPLVNIYGSLGKGKNVDKSTVWWDSSWNG